MEVTTERHGHVLIASVIGRIEPAGAQTLQTTIIAAVQNGDRAVVMDFEQLDYIGNVGLRVLRIIGRILRDRNAALVVCSPHGVVSAVFARDRRGHAHQGLPDQGRRARGPRRLTRRSRIVDRTFGWHGPRTFVSFIRIEDRGRATGHGLRRGPWAAPALQGGRAWTRHASSSRFCSITVTSGSPSRPRSCSTASSGWMSVRGVSTPSARS